MTAAGLTGLTDADRQRAMSCFEVLRPHLDDEVPLTRAAAQAGVPFFEQGHAVQMDRIRQSLTGPKPRILKRYLR
ncbi:hypothetical protein [Nocardia sp. NPDC058666]|uniref:hypothetical protein n=1 Tax=Nocardia sp. NPDC058666 TaxID=3346587 RepID=UPI00364BC010